MHHRSFNFALVFLTAISNLIFVVPGYAQSKLERLHVGYSAQAETD